MDKLKPMDVYAQLDVPVAVGIFCRQRKFTKEAIALHRALDARAGAKAAIATAEQHYENCEARVKQAIEEAQKRMEQADAIQP